MRVSYNGITSGFQPDDRSSIPLTRSNIMKDVFGREWTLVQLPNNTSWWQKWLKLKDNSTFIKVRDVIIGLGLINAVIWCMGWLSKLGDK